MKASLKSLLDDMPSEVPLPQSAAEQEPAVDPKRPTAKARDNTCQIAGHFAPHVGHALNVLAAEQGRHNQEMLAEALTMLFKRYGKPVVVEGKSRRRARV
jgi:hypothetical protein